MGVRWQERERNNWEIVLVKTREVNISGSCASSRNHRPLISTGQWTSYLLFVTVSYVRTRNVTLAELDNITTCGDTKLTRFYAVATNLLCSVTSWPLRFFTFVFSISSDPLWVSHFQLRNFLENFWGLENWCSKPNLKN